jgi:serine/threonine-protein kinase RsbW
MTMSLQRSEFFKGIIWMKDMATFLACYDSLADISKYVQAAAQQAGLDQKATYAVQLAVDEACCNIIDHAYGGEGNGDIQCSVKVGSDALTIVLVDHGRPYQPDEVKQPKLDLPISKVKRRGAGLYLMAQMMDKVSYESTPEATNRLTLVKRRIP